MSKGLGAMVALEDMDVAVGEVTDLTPDQIQEIDKTHEEAMAEVGTSYQEFQKHVGETTRLATLTEGAMGINKAIDQKLSNKEAITPELGKIAKISIEAIAQTLNLQVTVPSLEALESENTSEAANKSMASKTVQVLKDALKKLVEFVKNLYKKAKEHVKKLFGANASLKRKVETAKAKAKESEKEPSQPSQSSVDTITTFEHPSILKMLGADKDVDLKQCLSIYKNHCDVSGVVRRISAELNELSHHLLTEASRVKDEASLRTMIEACQGHLRETLERFTVGLAPLADTRLVFGNVFTAEKRDDPVALKFSVVPPSEVKGKTCAVLTPAEDSKLTTVVSDLLQKNELIDFNREVSVFEASFEKFGDSLQEHIKFITTDRSLGHQLQTILMSVKSFELFWVSFVSEIYKDNIALGNALLGYVDESRKATSASTQEPNQEPK